MCVGQYSYLRSNVGVVTTFYTLVGILSILFSDVALDIITCRVPMAQEMDSDAILAGQLVVWTTLVSAFSVFGATYILRLLGMLV